jgi:hypothetical protein
MGIYNSKIVPTKTTDINNDSTHVQITLKCIKEISDIKKTL